MIKVEGKDIYVCRDILSNEEHRYHQNTLRRFASGALTKSQIQNAALEHGDFLVDVVKGHRGLGGDLELDIKWRGQEYNPQDCWTKKIEDCRASPCSEKVSSRTQGSLKGNTYTLCP